jgi:glycosyltransferase involved in cell wall biosynthesis
MPGDCPNLLMVSGDATIAAGKRGAFYHMLERFAPAWSRIDVIVPRTPVVTTTELFGNVFVHPSPRPKALQWLHIVERGRTLSRQRQYALMTSHDYGWHYNGLGSWLLSRATGTPYVSEILHVTGYPHAAGVKEWMQGFVTRLYIRLVRSQVAGFRVDNAVELPGLLTSLGVPSEKILVLYALYIDHGVFRARATPKAYDVMFCGRADSNKGADILLRAVATLVKSRPSLTLLMRVAGREEWAWRRLANRLGISAHITWRSWVESPEELASLYCASRMLVCTSLSEGGPRVVAEAMACGTPVIATPVGVVPEIVEHGRSGLVVDWTPASVAAAIGRLLDDPASAAAIGVEGHQRVLRFERSAVIDAYASAYRRLADGIERRLIA